jgi:hypothetical protein
MCFKIQHDEFMRVSCDSIEYYIMHHVHIIIYYEYHYSPHIIFLHCLFFHPFMYSVNCGTPPVLSNGVIIPYTGTTEGAQAIILCRDLFHSSLLRDNYTVSMCTTAGQWEPDPNNYCDTLSGK